MKYVIKEVKERSEIRSFIEFPSKLYKSDPNWIRCLDAELEKQFNSETNSLLDRGAVKRWILMDINGDTVGRIAAFFDKGTSGSFEQPTGGVGFFDSIDDYEAAKLMFDTAKSWLQSNGMEAMNGPVNFGARDEFWGCLVDGFHEPVYNMPYNLPYYGSLFEKYGFQSYFNQHTYRLDLKNYTVHPIIRRAASRVIDNEDYSFKTFKKGDKQYAYDFMVIYNKAWAGFSGVKEMSEQEALGLMKSLSFIVDEELLYFGYYKGEPVAFFIALPDIGQITKNFNGKLGLLNKISLIYNLRVKKSVDRIVGKIFGIVPDHQNKGIEAALITHFEKNATKPKSQYRSLELNWIGDFNPVMMKLCTYIGGSIYKTHTTYQYLFDRDKVFKRADRVNL